MILTKDPWRMRDHLNLVLDRPGQLPGKLELQVQTVGMRCPLVKDLMKCLISSKRDEFGNRCDQLQGKPVMQWISIGPGFDNQVT